MKSGKNEIKRTLGIVAALSLILLVGLTGCNPRNSNTSLMAAAEVVWLEGEVSVGGESVDIGDEVLNGAEIITGPDSLLELSFGDYRILRAGENSRLVLDAVEREMKLDAGDIAVMQSKSRRFGSNKAWELHTPTTVAAVRGTVYFAKVTNPDETYFCLCNGKIHLDDVDSQSPLDLEAIHHNAVIYKRTDKGIDVSDGSMSYHTDAQIEALADRVHVPIDWTKISE